MAVVAGFLFVALIGLGVAAVGAGFYYVQVLRPRLESSSPPKPRLESSSPPKPGKESHEGDALTSVVKQLKELARLRDQGILTSREFSSKKAELLERI